MSWSTSAAPATGRLPVRAVAAPVAFAAAIAMAATSAFAQSDADDLYGIPAASSGTETGADTGAAPSSGEATPDEAVPADTVSPAAPSAPADTAAAAPAPTDTARPAAPRPRITRETTINPMDADRGGYRNPKKALFMSLLVPGLGQAYVGQSAFTYARAAVYFGTEITLGLLWRHYTVVKYDRQVKRYKAQADEHWSTGRYEEWLFDKTPQQVEAFERVNPSRDAYCDALLGDEATNVGINNGCRKIYSDDAEDLGDYALFADRVEDRGAAVDSVARMRARFASSVEFYALIADYQEFVAGWDDATGLAYGDSVIAGTSANRDEYAAMRRKAQEYSRMQAWFVGGIVLNHIASAVDAALTARRNNKRLYGDRTGWLDRVNLDGGLAFDRGSPFTHLTARLSF